MALYYGTPLITKALAEDGGGSATMVGASVRMMEARRGGSGGLRGGGFSVEDGLGFEDD